MARAELAHARALSDAFRGRYDLSSRRVRRALALVPPGPELELAAYRIRIRLLVLLAGMEYELGGGQSGREHLDEAVAVSDAVGAADLTFVVNQTLALRATRSGRSEEALVHFAAAEAVAGQADDLDVCKLLVNRGTLHLERLELAAARRDLELCLARAQDAPALVTLAMMARHNLGYLEFLAGDLPAALRLMSEAAGLGGQASAAVALLDRARVLTAAGLIDAADATLTEAGQHFRHGRMWAYLAEAELARAECALLTGRFALARALAGSARTRFRRRGNDTWRRRAELVLLGGDLSDGRPPSLLVGPAQRLADEFTGAGLPTYAKTARLIACEALTRDGRVPEAVALYDALPGPARTDVIALRLQQRTVGAMLARRRGARSAARRQVRDGLVELARHQAQFGSVDLQTASALHGRRLAALDLEMALATARPASVFAALERGRALSRRLVPVTPPTAESAPLLTELRQLTETLAVIGADPACADAAASTREQIAERQDRLRRLAWRSSGRRGASPQVRLPEVLDRVRSGGRQMVLFGRSGGELFAVVLGRRAPQVVRLSDTVRATAWLNRLRADLNLRALPQVPTSLRRCAADSARRCLRQLDAALLAPLRLTDDPLVVVPTADLATLPWNALPSLVGRPVEVSPTASAWWHGAREPVLGPVRVAGFAGPSLPAAAREVSALPSVWPGAETFLGPDATSRALTQTAGAVDVAHVAAHGVHVMQNPLFSSLQLADGPLFAYELEAGRLPAHLVLSACELGQVTVRPGEETLGLTSVLLQLGVACVVSGVADVADDLAAEVMAGYHQRLAAGADAAAALAAAAGAYGGSGRGEIVPFVCFGTAWSVMGSGA